MSYLDALQTTLAGEHAALVVIGYLGGQTSPAADPGLREALREAREAHRDRRDELVARVTAAGGDPVAADAAYELPDLGAGGPVAVRAEALRVERACGVTYGYLVASSPSDQRRYAIDLLRDSALRELDLGGAPRAFPGR